MSFWELTLSPSAETSEAFTNFLWELGALGVVEEEQDDAPLRLRAFFPGTAPPSMLSAAILGYRAALADLGFGSPARDVAVAPLLDGRWAEAWRQSFLPRPVGRRFLVVPPWHLSARHDGRQLLVIEPGRAFGTGHHESTRGCLTLLESFLETHRVPRAVDIGTGSGILAIAALLRGVPEVTALDIDPDALREARQNARWNGVQGRLSCHPTGPEALEGPFPLLVANLLRERHLSLAPHYRRLLIPGGTLILGGTLTEEEPAVLRALASHGLTLVERAELEGWVSLRLSRGGPNS